MSATKRLNRRGDLFPLSQIRHRRAQHAYQFLTLFCHILLEQRTQPRIPFEQVVVKQSCRRIGYLRHFGEAVLNEDLLFWRHGNLHGVGADWRCTSCVTIVSVDLNMRA
jgi:hypothetical protein